MSDAITLTKAKDYLARFAGRGWLHGTRDYPDEQEAVDLGLRKHWLRRELGEVHFTPKGRAALQQAAYTSATARLIKGLTPLQRKLVTDGCIHGDFTMATVRALKRKGLFSLVITSPNGQCGHMELTPLGRETRAALQLQGGASRG